MIHKIKELCAERHISIADLEYRAGLSERSVYKWDEVTPSVDKVYRVAIVLGTTVEDLLEE